jgi:hypothetical protein
MDSLWGWSLMGLGLVVFLFVFFLKTEPQGDDPRGKS